MGLRPAHSFSSNPHSNYLFFSQIRLPLDSFGKQLATHGFDFSVVKSRKHCQTFHNQLNEDDKRIFLEFLSEYVHQSFVKTKTVSPQLLADVLSGEGVYVYWVNDCLVDRKREP
jgi:hypothetical protein